MKVVCVAVACAFLLVACAKPASDGGTSDTLATSDAQSEEPELPVVEPTPAELERFKLLLINDLYQGLLIGQMAPVVPTTEELIVRDDSIIYTMSRLAPSYSSITDDFLVKGKFKVGLVSGEGQFRNVRFTVEGEYHFLNSHPGAIYATPGTTVEEITPYGPEFDIDGSQIDRVARDDIFLKAKVSNLTEADLAGYSADDLGYIRNEIFARHGHTFKTEKMYTYFSKQDWYFSAVDDAASSLNKFEVRNVEFIKKHEK